MLLTIDLGAATKFDMVGPDGAFIGGAIAPGFCTSADALVSRTALLPRSKSAIRPAHANSVHHHTQLLAAS